MPTGLKNSPAALAAPVANIGPRRAISQAYQIIFAEVGVAVRFPFVVVPLGCSVSLRGVNGTVINNSPALIGEQPNQIGQVGGRQIVSPDTEVSYPVDNLGQIWAMGAPGDGLLAYIRGSALP